MTSWPDLARPGILSARDGAEAVRADRPVVCGFSSVTSLLLLRVKFPCLNCIYIYITRLKVSPLLSALPRSPHADMKFLLALGLCGTALASLFAHQKDIVDLGYAKYMGNRSYSNAVAYLGVPYAEPPLGELRFRAPLPLNTTRVRAQTGGKLVNASAYPDFCVQGTVGSACISAHVCLCWTNIKSR